MIFKYNVIFIEINIEQYNERIEESLKV